jgi:hypothetical protein
LTAALQILDEVGADELDYAWVRDVAAVMAALFGDLPLARRESMLAIESGRRIGNPTILGIALFGFALASWQSDPMAARAALEEQVPIFRAVGDSNMLARALGLLAQLQARGGDLPDALEALREGLETAHISDERPAMAVCLARGATVMIALGEHEIAAVFIGALTNNVLARRSGVSPNEIPDYDEFITTIRSQLGDDRYKAATGRGGAMTYEAAGAFALAAIERLQAS